MASKEQIKDVPEAKKKVSGSGKFLGTIVEHIIKNHLKIQGSARKLLPTILILIITGLYNHRMSCLFVFLNSDIFQFCEKKRYPTGQKQLSR